MKTKFAAALSLSGVLVAGSAAALVNTQVLTGDDSSGSSVPVAGAPTSTDGSVPSSSSIPDTSLPTTTLPTDTSTTVPGTLPSTSSTSPASTQAIYRVGDAGMVTLDTVGDVLTVVAATPNSGWTVTKVERDGPLDIEVKFRSATVEVEFEASLLFGVIGTKVESKSLVAPPSSGSVPGPGTTIDDDDDGYDDHDDDDDDHDDDDHDDDHDDDDDDDDDDHDDD